MNLIIGREGDQPFTIRDVGVSRRHVSLDLKEDGAVLIEDLASGNGTFVNGRRIVKKQIRSTDQVRLGPAYLLNVPDVIRIMTLSITPSQASVKKSSGSAAKTVLSPEEEQRIKTQFTKLNAVYERCEKEKIALGKEKSTAMVMRSIPAVVVSLLLFLVSFFLDGGIVEILKLVLGGLSVILICVMTYRYYQVQKKAPEKMAAIKKQFMIDYVCPKCGEFLGNNPFETLRNQGECKRCKTKWV